MQGWKTSKRTYHPPNKKHKIKNKHIRVGENRGITENKEI